MIIVSGQLLFLKIGATVITNRGSSLYYKPRQVYYKSGQVLLIGTDLLQIGATITNWCRATILKIKSLSTSRFKSE